MRGISVSVAVDRNTIDVDPIEPNLELKKKHNAAAQILHPTSKR